MRHTSDVKYESSVSRCRSKDQQKQTTSVKLFSLDDVVTSRELSQSEFLDGYDRSRERPADDKRWDELSLTVRLYFICCLNKYVYNVNSIGS